MADFEYDSEKSDFYAKLELKGTSTTNPDRPRTTAAGYDTKNEILTVVFRDGTWWNYYGVSPEMWGEFVSAPSKGEYLRDSGLDTWDDMGPVNMYAMTPKQRGTLTAIAKDAARMQKIREGEQRSGETRGKDW